jgi:hypothetical protein
VKRRAQSGQALLEWVMVAMLATMAAVWAANEWVERLQLARAQAHAQWLRAVARALEQAIEHEPQRWRAPLAPGQAVALAPLLQQLKQAGWLTEALGEPLGMPYRLSVLRWQRGGACERGQCPTVVLLLAQPQAQAPKAAVLLMQLAGAGLAVTDLNPHRLQGPAFALPNPPGVSEPLPVGTVALLVWRSDREPPYVRIDESRPVHLRGGLQLGPLAQASGPCTPEARMMQSAAGQLLICQSGRWQDVAADHDHLRACRARQIDPLYEQLMRVSGLWSILGGEPGCDCEVGFGAVHFGSQLDHVGPIRLDHGFACLRL